MRSTCGTAFALTAITLATVVPVAFAQGARTPREIYKGAGPAVVVITTPSNLGSGVLIGASGLIVTNLHVIEDASEASVRLANGDVYDDVGDVDYDDDRDLALLKIKGDRLPVVELGDSETLETGDDVYAIGAPKGLEQTFSAGIVSAIRDAGAGYRRIQTTAPISHGSSGGGLFDGRGLLVGITQAIQDGENLNFAIPINYIKGMLDQETPRFTLAEVKARVAKAHAGRSDTPSAAAPTLANEYVSPDGNVLAFEKIGEALQATFSHRNGPRYAGASLQWNSDAGAFVGRGTLAHLCGRTAIQVPTTVAIVTVNESTIRHAWLIPDKVNCRSGKVESASPRTITWVVATGTDTPHQ